MHHKLITSSSRVLSITAGCAVLLLLMSSSALAQSVCLPAPRLLTTRPMGGQAGTTLEVTISGDHLESAEELRFSHPGITATSKSGDDGLPIPNVYVIAITPECPIGVHEARVMTRLGISSSRAFNVSGMPEVTQTGTNTSLETAMALEVDSICNASVARQAIDYFTFEAVSNQRIVVDCAAWGIDSKLKPVVVIADAEGSDLLVNRRGGMLDFVAPETAKYVVKVHDLTFAGGPQYFYRLALHSPADGEVVTRQPSVESVSSFSWPPTSLSDDAVVAEIEPNNVHNEAQQITLPCDISGSFFPQADVDTFEFTAKQGEIWWVEVASERLGLPTDPSIIVQHVSREGDGERLTDVVEFSDIPSPVKVSSNGYSYDGPPYNAGSSDIIGRLEIAQDGLHRLQIRDLFGGTRSDPQNVYRLVIRRAAPDFALVGWALHMTLRNGDRNALSKPIALRGGSTMALEVVVIRRDGFDGEIELLMDNLPEGVTATALNIPAGESQGKMLITAAADAPRGLTSADFYGRATIDGEVAIRSCRLASMQWPVPNAWSEIPSPRLQSSIPVSVCGSELAPITIAAVDDAVLEVTAGETLTIPLVHTRRTEFSGPTINLKTWCSSGIGNIPSFDAPLTEDASEAVLDLAALKTQPGEYTIAFYGSAVAMHRNNPDAVSIAEAALKLAREQAEALASEAQTLTAAAAAAPDDQKADAEAAAQVAAENQQEADAAVAAADRRLKDATAMAQPKDTVDIVISTPITIRVNPAEEAEEP